MKLLNYDRELGKALQRRRELAGYKHVNLADPIGVHRTTYRRFEKGTLAFTPGQLKIMAKELKTNQFEMLLSADMKQRNRDHKSILIEISCSLETFLEDCPQGKNLDELKSILREFKFRCMLL